MIRLYLNELSKNVIGYEYILWGQPVYRNDIVIEENYENIRLLNQAINEHNVYFSNGVLISGEVDKYFSLTEEIRKRIGVLSEKVSDEYRIIVDLVIQGRSLEEAAEEIKNNRIALESTKSELNEKTSEHEIEVFNYCANLHAEKEKKLNQAYYSSVCLLIRDENRYLKEWIEWHIGIGINHIYIYDNGVNENVSEIISILPQDTQEKITVVDWHGDYENVQQDAYNHWLETYGSETRWVNFIDSDEFIKITAESDNINEVLKPLEAYTTIYGNFIEYNANGQETYEDKPVKERFTQTSDVGKGLYHKDFIQPFRIDFMDRHYPMFSRRGNYTLQESEDKFVVDHYYTKSWEEWCEKINRGSSDPKYLKHKNEFFIYNPDMVYLKADDEIQEYKA